MTPEIQAHGNEFFVGQPGNPILLKRKVNTIKNKTKQNTFPFVRALIPIMRAPPIIRISQRPHLLKPPQLALGFQHMDLGGGGVEEGEGDANIQTTAPPYQCTCILEGLRTREISYYTEAEWWWKIPESPHYSDLGILVINYIIVDH